MEHEKTATDKISQNVFTFSDNTKAVTNSMSVVSEGANKTDAASNELSRAIKILIEQNASLEEKSNEFLMKMTSDSA